MTKELINLENIVLQYEGSANPVLDGLSLTVNEGDRILLSGANGSGKTSLFKLIIGLLKKSSGSIRAYGRNTESEKDFYELRTKTGLLFQNPEDQLFCATVEEDIAFGPFNLGWSREKVKNSVREILEKLEITGYEKRITSKLSGGEKRLVSLASVIVMQPEILLLDEPSSGLDEAHLKKLEKILAEWPGTLIMISHEKEFASKICSSEMRLSTGKIIKIYP